MMPPPSSTQGSDNTKVKENIDNGIVQAKTVSALVAINMT
jgi:hypothetical protein